MSAGSDWKQAYTLLKTGSYTCVMCRGERIYTSQERGIVPLLHWLDTGIDAVGYAAADTIVGKAAAYLYVRLGVDYLYADVISHSGLVLCNAHGIQVEYGSLTECIRNRNHTGNCPMEEAVSLCNTSEEAYVAIQQRCRELGLYSDVKN